MPSKSKTKGSGFEREISKYLSDLYGENFMRAPGSGAFTGGSNSHRKEILHEGQIRTFKGDIIPGQSFGLFNAEAKFYADFAFHQLLEESKILENWIDQMMQASDPYDLNLLFMKFNRKGRYIAVQTELLWTLPKQYNIYTSKKHGRWMICAFEPFFELNAQMVKLLSTKTQTSNSTPHST